MGVSVGASTNDIIALTGDGAAFAGRIDELMRERKAIEDARADLDLAMATVDALDDAKRKQAAAVIEMESAKAESAKLRSEANAEARQIVAGAEARLEAAATRAREMLVTSKDAADRMMATAAAAQAEAQRLKSVVVTEISGREAAVKEMMTRAADTERLASERIRAADERASDASALIERITKAINGG